nr:DNA (cytosine-5)-methyltransferase 1B-like isoform X2 [Lolium perenne]XP_051185697.1 DNA (cytosine-5)-methyltransferase 1B-like isoform X2 [Lolium perenne]
MASEKFPSNVKIMAVILKATVVLKKNKGKKISENDEVDSGKWTELPDEAKELDKKLCQITKDKNEALRGQDFEKAGKLRDEEMEMKARSSNY